MSSLFGLLLEPLDGGVFNELMGEFNGGSKYDNNSIGSTTVSDNSCENETKEKRKFSLNN